MQTIFCNNCGDRGHAFRECKKPVLSCGILLLRNKERPNSPVKLPINVEDIELLMIRRKDSMSYTEFMRGKYDINDSAYVSRLLQNMTQSEIESLNTQTFESLWSKMWNNVERYDHEMRLANEKFDAVFEIVKESSSVYTEPEWGFPKGRRYRCESDLQCAEREFFEETNIPRSAYISVKDVEFNEIFIGTNGIPYEHKYYLGIVVQPDQVNIHQKFTPVQRREISAIGWKTLSDCIQLTRPHYSGRESLLVDLSNFVKSVEVRIPNFVGDDNGNTGVKLTA
jgi:8-oxo-dGTP pyrophosphatase MutT (NUDIX family)